MIGIKSKGLKLVIKMVWVPTNVKNRSMVLGIDQLSSYYTGVSIAVPRKGSLSLRAR